MGLDHVDSDLDGSGFLFATGPATLVTDGGAPETGLVRLSTKAPDFLFIEFIPPNANGPLVYSREAGNPNDHTVILQTMVPCP
jgi:hypothetical protein